MIGIDDVFDARIACGGSTSSARRKIASFTALILDDRLDQEIGRHEVADRLDALEHAGRLGAALRRELRERTLDRGESALDCTRRRVVQRDPAAGRRDDLSDPAAHLARANDENMLERHRAAGYRRAHATRRCERRPPLGGAGR